MKTMKMKTACVALAGMMMLSSCIGSFGLTNKVLSWNKELTNSKFANELLFIAMHIVPVYEITVLADVLILNSIEFWSGDNPVADNNVKTLKGENDNYLVETTEKGYSITKEGEETPIELTFDKKTQSWNVTTEGETFELMKMNDNGTVDLNMQNGSYMNVNSDAAGVLAARQILMNSDVQYALR